MGKKLMISGTGCCLVDLLYNHIHFDSESFKAFLSKQAADGGLTPGHLVFQEEFEQFAGIGFEAALSQITGDRGPDKMNIGGPSIVSLIHVSQVTDPEKCEVHFYGRTGNDEAGTYLLNSMKQTKVVLKDMKQLEQPTPATYVLSDPDFDNGQGERIFINSIGAAWQLKPEDLPEHFFDSDIVVFGGTALVPNIHDHLTSLLKKAKLKNCLTIVNTVYDFRNEQKKPNERWPMGESDESYSLIDLLITDREEARRLSGMEEMEDSLDFFREKGVSSAIITNGAKNILAYSDGKLFGKVDRLELPVCERIGQELKSGIPGDTTGCGDNFAGGVIASLANQLIAGNRFPDLKEACMCGVVAGGFTCFYVGGTWLEKKEGEKRQMLESYYESYQKQIGNK